MEEKGGEEGAGKEFKHSPRRPVGPSGLPRRLELVKGAGKLHNNSPIICAPGKPIRASDQDQGHLGASAILKHEPWRQTWLLCQG